MSIQEENELNGVYFPAYNKVTSVSNYIMHYEDFEKATKTGTTFTNSFMQATAVNNIMMNSKAAGSFGQSKGLWLGYGAEGAITFTQAAKSVSFVIYGCDKGTMKAYDTNGNLLKTLVLPQTENGGGYIVSVEAPAGATIGKLTFNDNWGVLVDNVTINSPVPMGANGAITGPTWTPYPVSYEDFEKATKTGTTFTNSFMKATAVNDIMMNPKAAGSFGQSKGLWLGYEAEGAITFTQAAKSVSFVIYGCDKGTMKAYDTNGNLLKTLILPQTENGGGYIVSVEAPAGVNIGKLTFSDNFGVLVDNVTINSTSPIGNNGVITGPIWTGSEPYPVSYEDFEKATRSGSTFTNSFMTATAVNDIMMNPKAAGSFGQSKGLWLGYEAEGAITFTQAAKSVSFVIYGCDKGTMKAYDTNGNLLKTLILPQTENGGGYIVSVEAPAGTNIGKLTFNDTAGVLVDNVTINSTSPMGANGAITGPTWTGSEPYPVSYEDFEKATRSGSTFTNSFMKATAVNDIMMNPKAAGSFGQSKGLWLGYTYGGYDSGTISFIKPASSVSFVIYGCDKGTMKAYDTNGNLLKTLILPQTENGGGYIVSVEAPAGVNIGKLTFNDNVGVLVDNVTINSTSPMSASGPITGPVWSGALKAVALDDTDMDHHVSATDSVTLASVSGSEGKIDKLILDGHDLHLDLTKLSSDTLSSIEHIDISGNGANKLTLSIQDVLSRGEVDLVLKNNKTQFIVSGDTDDTLNIIQGADKLQANGSVVIDNTTYKMYDNAAQTATLHIEDKVQVILG